MKRFFLKWIHWRYGEVQALKPPLGWHPVYSPRPWWWRLSYQIKRGVWKLENKAFLRASVSAVVKENL